MLLEELTLLLEAEDLKKEIQKIAMKATSMPVTFRTGASHEMYVVIDGTARGKQGADDHELNVVMKKIESELESEEHSIERLYHSNDDAERPNGLQIFSKRGDNRTPMLKVKFIKKSIPRAKSDGDTKAEYLAYKVALFHDKPGQNNELHFVGLLKEQLKNAGGLIKELVFDGYTNNKSFSITNVVSVKWVGNKNGKADVLFFNDDGEITRVSLKQRNFFEINAGEEFFANHEANVNKYLDQAIDTAQVKLDDTGKFSKEKHFEIAVQLTQGEARDAYFGRGKDTVDAVIVETFLAKDFKLIGTKLTVHCDYVLTSIDDVHDRLLPYLAINSDFEKNLNYAKPVRGRTFLSIVPRFRLKPHARKTTKYPKTLVLSR